MKWLILALLVLVFVVPAVADKYGRISATNVVAVDYYGRPITNTFYQNAGDCEVDVWCGTDVALGDEPVVPADSVDVEISSGGMVGWLLITIPAETNVTVMFIRFKESVDGVTHSYTWGDWAPCYVEPNEVYRDAFNVGLWEACQIVLAASSYCKADVYYRMERISDD